jgi:hypothetical protein
MAETRMAKSKRTALDVAKWMFEQVKTGQYLYQETCAYQIIDEFGEEFTYDNKNYNKAIRKDVLVEFLKLTFKTVVWCRGDRYWRLREEFDEPGRQQE